MNNLCAQLPEFFDRLCPKKLLLFPPDQVRLKLARLANHRIIDLVDNRSPLQAFLYLALEPRGMAPWLDCVHSSHDVAEAFECPHPHVRCLARMDWAEEKDLHRFRKTSQVYISYREG